MRAKGKEVVYVRDLNILSVQVIFSFGLNLKAFPLGGSAVESCFGQPFNGVASGMSSRPNLA